MQKQLLVLSVFLTAAFASRAEIQPIVVDDEDIDMEFKGNWQHVDEFAKFTHNKGFHYSMAGIGNEANAIATFRPKVPADGKYHVELFFGGGKNRSPSVPCVISGADGEMNITVDQTQAPATWHRIADNIFFKRGTSGFVQVRNNCGYSEKTDKIVIVDAMRLVPASLETVPQFKLVSTADAG